MKKLSRALVSVSDKTGLVDLGRGLAALGMLVSATGLACMTTLVVHSPYWQSGLWLLIVGVGSGMFNSPNTAAMMGTVPAHRRGVAAGARTLLQNTGAVLSIAFVLFLAVRRMIVGPEAEGVFTLFGVAFFLIGITLFGIGLLGEYIGRIYEQVRERHRYVIQATLEKKE